MRWTERQRAMLRAMGVRWFDPAARAAAAPLDHDTAVLDAPAPVASAGAAAAVSTPKAATVAAPASAAAIAGPIAGPIARLDWDALRATVAACRACPLGASRQQAVFGVGNRQAHWMIVGEAPGEQEDAQGEPFVGASGQLLEQMLRSLGLTREAGPPERQVFIANTLKCRPPKNRNPEPAETAQCAPYLARQIELVAPRILLAMGRFAAQALLGSDEPVGRLRGRVHHVAGRPLVVTYHPAYLLRTPGDKARAWEDLCLAADVAERGAQHGACLMSPPGRPEGECRSAQRAVGRVSESAAAPARAGRAEPAPAALELEAAALRSLPWPVLVVGADGRAHAVNESLCRFAGLDEPAAHGLGWWSAVDARDQPPLREALAAASDFRLQIALRPPAGDAAAPVWVDINAHWLAPSGRYLCQWHDVSAASQALGAARERADLLRTVANSVPALMAFYDADSFRCLFANAGYARTFGHDEVSVLGRTFDEIIGEEAARVIEPYVREVREHKRAVRYERQIDSPEGTRWVEVQLVPHLLDDGSLRGSFVLINDITRHREAERALRESEERLAKFMQASVEGIVFHKDGVITDANPPILALTGHTLEEIIGRKNLEFIAPDHIPKVLEMMASGAETAYESVLLHRDGTRIPVEFIVRTIMRGGERLRMTIVRDLRDRDAARSHIYHLAHHDPLTGLLNRMAFMERLEVLMTSGRAGDAVGALLFIDLDQFKRVNDSLGHLAGDVLLQTLAARLKQLLRGSDLVARFGGDEFLVLLPGALPLADVHEVAKKVLVAFAAPVQLEGRRVSVTPSVGIALYPRHATTPSDLVRCADAAMYAAKQQGRATQCLYDPELGRAALAAIELESQLSQAVERDEFLLHYQPQVRASDGALVGAEALIRWRHPTRGLVEPDHFIPMLEQHRLLAPIGLWVLREAVRAARRWQLAGQPLPVSVNVASLQFRDEGFGTSVAQVLREEGLGGEWLELEITERMLMDDLDAVRSTLEGLKTLGVRIAIDDFGTGYSSLSRLSRLPIDRIKIDRSFVRGLPEHAGHAAIARAIVMLAQSLGLATIAEGVETEAQRGFLVALGCEEMQGLLFGAPQPAQPFALAAFAAGR